MKTQFVLLSLLLIGCSSNQDLSEAEEQEAEIEQIDNPYPNPPHYSMGCNCFIDEGGNRANGTYTLFHDSGSKRSVTTYNNGIYTELFWYYESGQLQRYEAGDSILVVYYENGQKDQVSRYLNSEKEGRDTNWYENGQIKELSDWSNGNLLYLIEYDEEGNIIKEIIE